MTTALTHQVVRASAGTGKTYALTQRYIRLLRRGAGAETILAATFTRKAAGEILERLLERLAEAASSKAAAARLAKELGDAKLDTAACRAMLTGVCRSLHRVTICTIDSFFNRMVRCFALELDVPGSAMIVDDRHPVAAQLRRQAIDAMLGDADLPLMLEMLRRIHHDAAQRSVTEALDNIVAGQMYDLYRGSPQRQCWTRLRTPEGYLETPRLAEATAALAALADEMPNATWANAFRRHIDCALNGTWDDFCAGGLTKVIAAGGDSFSRKAIPGHLHAALVPLIAHAKAWLIARVARQTEATFDLLERFDAHYAGLRRMHGVMRYSDLPHKLATELPALSEDLATELYFRLDTRVTHLMLDEFQDTSGQQWSILKPFAQEICAHGDSEVSGRSFFCVGDVKQAIYGWRGGCAEIFDRIEKDLFLGRDAGGGLSKSYRSSQVVLDVVNCVFGTLVNNGALGKHRERAAVWQSRFVEHEAADRGKPGYVELLTSPCADDADEDATSGEYDGTPSGFSRHDTFVAERIAALAAAAPNASIGVLTRTNKAVPTLIHLLRQRCLDASGEGGVPLTDDPAVNVVLSALRLADHPGHSAAAFHVVNSPMGAVVGLKACEPAAMERTSLALRRLLAERGYGQVLNDWARRLAPSCAARSAQRLAQLLELADGYQPLAAHRPMDFVRFVEATNVEEPTPARIRVMTVHKAKGLEFDAVVLPELGRALDRQGDALAYVLRDEPTGPPSAIYRAAHEAVRAMCPPLAEAYEQEMDRQFHDELCALYVAMTRPRHALHMMVAPLTRKKDGAFGARGTTTASFAAILRNALCEIDETDEGEECLFRHGDPDWPGRLPALPSASRPETPGPAPVARTAVEAEPDHRPRRSWRRMTPSGLERQGQVRASDLLTLTPQRTFARGLVIHAWLESIAWLAPGSADQAGPNDAELRRIARAAADDLAEDWLDAELAEFKAALVRPQVRAVFTKPAGDVELWRERRFAAHAEGALIEGAFDRVIVHRQRDAPVGAELIDFKTDRVPDAGVEELVEVYRPQLHAYRKVLAHLLGLDPRKVEATLLFWSSGQRVAL